MRPRLCEEIDEVFDGTAGDCVAERSAEDVDQRFELDDGAFDVLPDAVEFEAVLLEDRLPVDAGLRRALSAAVGVGGVFTGERRLWCQQGGCQQCADQYPGCPSHLPASCVLGPVDG